MQGTDGSLGWDYIWELLHFAAHMQIKIQLKVELFVSFHMGRKHWSNENKTKKKMSVWNR